MTQRINEYKPQFQRFVDFAKGKVESGKGKAIASLADGTQPLETRKVTAAKSDGVGGFSSLFRSKSAKQANDLTRANFMDAVINVFGGESKIPASVKAAMREKDYGQGKPLTARRIMVVKAAIDNVKSQAETAFATAKASAHHAYDLAGWRGPRSLTGLSNRSSCPI